ncbi:MAG: hypothetical protein AAF182_03665 [Pseudomonadota bacterium]
MTSMFFAAAAESYRPLSKDILEKQAIRAALVGAGVILMEGQVERLVRHDIESTLSDRELSDVELYEEVQNKTLAFFSNMIDMQKQHAPVRSYDPENPFVKLAGSIRYIDPNGPAKMYPGPTIY